ncbi:MAG: hypothetical protein L0I29_11385 [Hyphomicrobiales bacterium]|nr:hypothetical protein [Hyphomicrobiales bacterium]
MPSPIYLTTVEGLGAVPVPVDWSEVPTRPDGLTFKAIFPNCLVCTKPSTLSSPITGCVRSRDTDPRLGASRPGRGAQAGFPSGGWQLPITRR